MNKPVLEIKNIFKKYSGKEVVNNEGFMVYEGDILGFIGSNDAT